MLVILVSMLAPDLCLLPPDAANIGRLIAQLGSEFYARREAATKALGRIGEPTLDALRTACESSEDVEIRRRAERLVKIIERRVIEERALAIRQSKLSPEEKGRRLRPYIKDGMLTEEITLLLGRPSAVFHSAGSCTYGYAKLGLMIVFDRYGSVLSE